ncbi:MAG: hypothetical protein N4A45_09465 [Flavobacteriales bacterium]|nr:hypothetical protein [Flavobacteriales bacterium]
MAEHKKIGLNKENLKITLILTLIPTFVFANAGSPMMWFGILHSLLLNSLIGFYESKYLEKNEIENRMWLIIIGNYFSMFIGFYYIAPYFSTITGNIDFWGGSTSHGNYELNGFIFGMLASFVATLILELPFYLLSVKEIEKRKKGIWTYLEANSISNLVMFLIYFMIVAGGSR